jgi:hypothetical protein
VFYVDFEEVDLCHRSHTRVTRKSKLIAVEVKTQAARR